MDDRRPSRRGACRRWACHGDAADACAEPEKCLKTSRATRIPEKKRKENHRAEGNLVRVEERLGGRRPGVVVVVVVASVLVWTRRAHGTDGNVDRFGKHPVDTYGTPQKEHLV